MRVLGIDPGLRNTGWGVIVVDGPRLQLMLPRVLGRRPMVAPYAAPDPGAGRTGPGAPMAYGVCNGSCRSEGLARQAGPMRGSAVK